MSKSHGEVVGSVGIGVNGSLYQIVNQICNSKGAKLAVKSDRYVLSEINPMCITVTTHTNKGIQDAIAREVVRQASEFK